MTETNSAIELNGVSKSFGETVAVDDVDLGVEAGTVHVLIGPSGCGKSTLLRLVMALAEPDRGTIRVGGRPLEQRNRRAVRRQMGYVIQSGGLFPHLTARENVALPAENVGWSRDRIDRRLGELSELTRFPETEFDQYPSELSGGQQQRVSLMRALMLEPSILLMDEPASALDPIATSKIE
ncbi:MAG: ATP-binding cassette domain-containing protein, partial [Bradymonadaceae bacterium]